MRIGNKQSLLFLAIGWAGMGIAATVSYTGTMANAEDVFETTATLARPEP